MEIPTYTFFRGRVAMAAMLRGLGVGKGDGVAIQAFTCVAVPEAVQAVGAAPRYVDTGADAFTMDPDHLESVLTPEVRAIVVQHTFGLPADLARILPIAERRGIPIIEDCAHSVASTVGGRTIGSFGAGAFYSFEASKPIFIGIGGAARINDRALTDAMARLWPSFAWPGLGRQLQVALLYVAGLVAYRPATYWTVRSIYRAAVRLGILRGNYNPVDDAAGPADDFGRRLGSLQQRTLRRALRRVDHQTRHRRWVADAYRRTLKGRVQHPTVPDGHAPVFGRYPLLVDDRPAILARARRHFVELADFYATPVHPLAGDRLRAVAYTRGECPNAEAVCQRVVSLPTATTVGGRAVRRAARLFAG